MSDATQEIDCDLLGQLLAAPASLAFDQLRVRAGKLNAALDTLRRAGCQLDVHPQRGVRLIEAGLGTWSDYLSHRFGPRIIEVYQRTASTQDVVRRMIETRGIAALRAVAVCDEQSAGRGRLGRRWVAPAGAAVLFSTAMVCDIASAAPKRSTDHLTLIAAVAVARGIEAACHGAVTVEIKWPNDLLIHRRKVAGILVESQQSVARSQPLHAAILGIGINVRLHHDDIPADLHDVRDAITSLAMAGCEADRLRVLVEVLAALDIAGAQNDTTLLDEWRQRCITLNERVTLRNDGRIIRGEVIDLDPREGLILRTDTGSITHLPAATTTTAE